MFESVICNSLFNHFLGNTSFTPSQAGFLPGENKNNTIIHEIQTAFDDNPTVDPTDVFLGISKAFDKVWHRRLIFKIKPYSAEFQSLSLLKNCSKNCEQKVALNDQTSG